jgi:hypothetical protein
MRSELSIPFSVSGFVKKGRWHYLGPVVFEEPSIELSNQASYSVRARLILDPYGLKKIEELRGNGNIRYIVYAKANVLDQDSRRLKAESNFEGEIARSNWVEKFLPAFGYKEVVLLEIPIVSLPQFKKISDHLNDAWEQLSMGECNVVLTCCRRAIERLGTIVREKGYKTKDENGKPIPDWSGFFGNDELGDIVGTINRKIYGFTWPGAHAGKSVNREDADYALMITHATANIVVKKFLGTEK